MFYYSYGAALHGMEVQIIHVEADVSDGLPIFSLVGLLGSEIKESRERVRISIKNSGYRLLPKRITVNLSPADIRKEGTGFDLPIALSVLCAYGFLSKKGLKNLLSVGELSLDGTIKPVNGILPIVYEAKQKGFQACLVSRENEKEGNMVEGITIIGADNLKEAIEILNQKEKWMISYLDANDGVKRNELKRILFKKAVENQEGKGLDFSQVAGQETLKRGLEVAAAGMHHVLMVGPPGAGKTMLAKRIPTILPDLSLEEAMEISKIYSIAGLLKGQEYLITKRPFRAPHSTTTPAALAGGGRNPGPGELSLSKGGVLFLDEAAEFKRESLEVLRQPLEEGVITISRVQGSYCFPADFMLVAAMNPCPCGYYPDKNRCFCTDYQIKKYLGRLSGPLWDRIDITLEAFSLPFEELKKTSEGENSKTIKERVKQARNIQKERFQKENICYNSQMTPELIGKYCMVGEKENRYLEEMFFKLRLSGRSYHRVLKVARTAADLAGEDTIKLVHLAEAVSYRSMEGLL